MKLQLLALPVNKPQIWHAWESKQAQKSLKFKCKMYAMIRAFPIISMYLNMNYCLTIDSIAAMLGEKTLRETQFWAETSNNFMQQDLEVTVNLFTAQVVSKFLQSAVAGAVWARNSHSLIYPMDLPYQS